MAVEKLNRGERLLATLLGLLAGFVDAIGFIALGGFFVSFMSGNTTRMGVSLVLDVTDAIIAASLIGCFVIGVIAGSAAGHAAGHRRKPVVLALVAALLMAAPLVEPFGARSLTIGAVTAAMGAVNAVFEHQGDVRFGLTYMTGALVKAGQRLALALRGGPRFDWAPYLLQWSALAVGAALGAAAYPAAGLSGLWIAAAVAIALALYSARLRHREP
jgi:uncharacterized membrane protein YoaK (UPF0700 family)